MRLRASNTLGKLLLGAERWTDAERHFADDETRAACFGDSSSELRARLNRAIAVLSAGRLAEAHAMLVSVLEQGTRRRDDRAVARALMNLAVMAINAQRYGEALSLSERAIVVRRRLGERVGLAWIITNLAELRLRLGLVDEAEHAVAFGRRALSAGDAGGRGARFSFKREKTSFVSLTAGKSIFSIFEHIAHGLRDALKNGFKIRFVFDGENRKMQF